MYDEFGWSGDYERWELVFLLAKNHTSPPHFFSDIKYKILLRIKLLLGGDLPDLLHCCQGDEVCFLIAFIVAKATRSASWSPSLLPRPRGQLPGVLHCYHGDEVSFMVAFIVAKAMRSASWSPSLLPWRRGQLPDRLHCCQGDEVSLLVPFIVANATRSARLIIFLHVSVAMMMLKW